MEDKHMSTTTVNISFQKDLLSDIDKVAKKESRSRSELLREAARMYIERRHRWDKVFTFGETQVRRKKLSKSDVAAEIAAHRRQKSRKR